MPNLCGAFLVRKSKPEQHTCSVLARKYLTPFLDGDKWVWQLSYNKLNNGLERYGMRSLIVQYCPWCGSKLPDRGRLVLRQS